MSGQPNMNASDTGKFREQYLSSLELRSKLDNVNLQANRLYKRTGQLPSEPSDFRSLEEKLADSERLRHEARASLTDIADGREANKISIEMTPDQLLFYSQQKDTINPIIKQQFRLGVYADTFLPFLTQYMNDTAANYGVSTGLQQSSGRNVMLNGENLFNQITNEDQINALLDIVADHQQTPEYEKMEKALDALKIVLGSNGLGDRPYMVLKSRVTDEAALTIGYEILNDIIQEIPTKVQISRKMELLRRYIGAGDAGQVRAEMFKTAGLATPTNDVAELMASMTQHVQESEAAAEAVPPVSGETSGGEKSAYGEYASPAPTSAAAEESAGTFDELTDLLEGTNDKEKRAFVRRMNQKAGGRLYKLTGTDGNLRDIKTYVLEWGDTLSAIEDATSNAAVQEILRGIVVPAEARYATPKKEAGAAGGGDTTPPYVKEEGSGFKGMVKRKITGRGLAAKAKPPRQYHKPTATDWNKGVNPTKRFVPIGRYIINKHRLDGDVVAMKRPAGSCIKEFPSTRVSSKLGSILRHIVGGGIPEFNDLEDLDDNEKAYLHNLAKETHIIDRLSIPAPKKSESDKEIDKFNIMRGEIMSGNDNKELVKKFKLLTMKLMNRNLLPKGQARDILFDLTSMGF